MQSTIHFYGGTGAVTGSNFLLESGSKKIIIDCGLFQGQHACEETNWSAFPYDPKEVSTLVITHAHIDHIGRIPRFIKEGFKGVIYSTEATKALAHPLLEDALELLGREAARCNRDPLYEKKDIDQAMQQWKGIAYHESQELGEGFRLEFFDAGHILGSAMAKLSRGDKSIVFTGDLGGGNSPLLPPTESIEGASYLVMESVYGDRVRTEDMNRREFLENIIEDTAARKGTLLIPAFSTERTQDLLFEIRNLMVEKRIPSLPVYLDSPLAQKITEIFIEHLGKGDIFSFSELRFVEDFEESQKLHTIPNPKIILAGSGMSNGGRILAHDLHVLPDKNSTLLIVGYQAAGSLGRRLLEGAKEVSLKGQKVPVRCSVEAIYGYSAHMDGENLLEFVNNNKKSLKKIFVVMGEPAASGTLVQRIRDFIGLNAVAPEAGEKAVIEL